MLIKATLTGILPSVVFCASVGSVRMWGREEREEGAGRRDLGGSREEGAGRREAERPGYYTLFFFLSNINMKCQLNM